MPTKPEAKPRNLTMPIISFSKKVLDEYVDTFTSNSNELLEPQIKSLEELIKSSREAKLDVRSYPED
jgi:hypothetical protein